MPASSPTGDALRELTARVERIEKLTGRLEEDLERAERDIDTIEQLLRAQIADLQLAVGA